MLEIFTYSTTAWIALSFVVFFVVIGKLAGAKIIKLLDTKILQIRQEIETAERLKAEAQSLLEDFRQKQKDAEKAAAEIIAQARASAQALQHAAEAELAESMARREAQLSERLKRIEEKAIADIQSHAADLAVKATREIISKSMDEKTGNHLIDQAIQSVSKYLN